MQKKSGTALSVLFVIDNFVAPSITYCYKWFLKRLILDRHPPHGKDISPPADLVEGVCAILDVGCEMKRACRGRRCG